MHVKERVLYLRNVTREIDGCRAQTTCQQNFSQKVNTIKLSTGFLPPESNNAIVFLPYTSVVRTIYGAQDIQYREQIKRFYLLDINIIKELKRMVSKENFIFHPNASKRRLKIRFIWKTADSFRITTYWRSAFATKVVQSKWFLENPM